MADIRIMEQSVDDLREYGTVPIAFQVEQIFDVTTIDNGLGGIVLQLRDVENPYVKDYDGIRGEGPARWSDRWDISNWGVLAAFDGDLRIGGCVLAYDTPGVCMLGGRKDLTVLWDLRVAPGYRGTGVGSRLFNEATEWARRRGCSLLCVETQNINVPACRFYEGQGCQLGHVNRYAYDQFPDEVQLVWYLNL